MSLARLPVGAVLPIREVIKKRSALEKLAIVLPDGTELGDDQP